MELFYNTSQSESMDYMSRSANNSFFHETNTNRPPVCWTRNLKKLMYLEKPSDSSFAKPEDVPYYFSEVFPLFLGLVVAEYIALLLKGKGPRLGESLNSLAHGILAESTKVLTMGLEISLYIFIHENYRLINLPWESPFTWYLALLGVDFAYYWAHRASHEIHFLWIQHQVHHSSEDFNIAVAVRHPVTHNWINSFFYLPLALILPPSQCLAHQQLNSLYQGWIHSSLVGTLGPLEYIFNTPSHHKVHHGCNLYALDKNYGGLLIVWDRIFGTFQTMKKGEEVIYGTVFQHQSHNPIWQMYYRWPSLWKWARAQSTWRDSLKAIFYGPSWVPGAPRLGRDSDKVNVKPRPKFHVELSPWLQAYILFHFFIVCLVFHEFALKKGKLDEWTIASSVSYLLLTLTSIGLLSEGNIWGSYFELFRCMILTLASSIYYNGLVKLVYLIPSMTFWAGHILLNTNYFKRQEPRESSTDEDSDSNNHVVDTESVPKLRRIQSWSSSVESHDYYFNSRTYYRRRKHSCSSCGSEDSSSMIAEDIRTLSIEHRHL